nr:IS66 family insertion sequence element accessory protein TnpB [Photobacterium toruni]
MKKIEQTDNEHIAHQVIINEASILNGEVVIIHLLNGIRAELLASLTMIPRGAIYLVSGITDMRKSIDGLSLIVADVLEMDPLSSAWFIFCNRGKDKIKILFW